MKQLVAASTPANPPILTIASMDVPVPIPSRVQAIVPAFCECVLHGRKLRKP